MAHVPRGTSLCTPTSPTPVAAVPAPAPCPAAGRLALEPAPIINTRASGSPKEGRGRPQEANERQTPGHWEADLAVQDLWTGRPDPPRAPLPPDHRSQAPGESLRPHRRGYDNGTGCFASRVASGPCAPPASAYRPSSATQPTSRTSMTTDSVSQGPGIQVEMLVSLALVSEAQGRGQWGGQPSPAQ